MNARRSQEMSPAIGSGCDSRKAHRGSELAPVGHFLWLLSDLPSLPGTKTGKLWVSDLEERNMSEKPKPKRRFRFSLRTLLIVVVLLSVGLGWFAVRMRQAERQRKAVEAIREVGATVTYDYARDDIEYIWLAPPREHPSAPTWLRELVGDDFLADVDDVHFNFHEEVGDVELEHVSVLRKLTCLELSATQVTDVGTEHLTGLIRLEWLDLSGTHVTDDGLQHLKGLTNLEYLDLSDTQVTDGGLENLKGLTKLDSLMLCGTQVTDVGLQRLKRLTNLEYLALHGTHITKEGIEELRKALPNCEIIWEPPKTKPRSQP